MKTCNDCIYFKRDNCSIKGDCFKPLISPTREACSYFKSKGVPDTETGPPAMTKPMLAVMAVDMAEKTSYDMVDWKTRSAPKYKYPHVEKALRR